MSWLAQKLRFDTCTLKEVTFILTLQSIQVEVNVSLNSSFLERELFPTRKLISVFPKLRKQNNKLRFTLIETTTTFGSSTTLRRTLTYQILSTLR